MKNNNNSNYNNSNRNNNSGNTNFSSNTQHNQHNDRKRQHNHHNNSGSGNNNSNQQQQLNQHHQQHQGQRDRSSQRNQGGQHPDSSMSGRDRDPMNQYGNSQTNLGSIRFSSGVPTRELPPIETKADPSKKFTGRCRLFVGNLPHNTSEDKLRTLFEGFGEVGEVYLGPKSAFAFIKMDTRQTAEAARDALDCSTYEGRTLRVRLAAHAAAIRVKHLSTQVTNELLAYAFRYFGEIERAVVVVDDKGKSVGEGIVEYSKKQSALYAIKRCQQECFMLTASPKPVLVEPFDQQDEDEGLPEKSINKNSTEFKEQRDIGPRFAEQGTFEHNFALRWKELYEIEKQKHDRLEAEIQEARKNLQDQIEYSRLEHDTMQLRSRLQQLEDNRLKLQQLKEQTLNDAQQRDDQRRQQDMLIRQREEDILRRQQLGDPNGINQQESSLRMQATALQDLLSNKEHTIDDTNESGQSQQKTQQAGSQVGHEADSGTSMNMMNPQMPSQIRSFADAAMMAMNQQPYLPVQQPMGMHPTPQMNPPNMFTAFMPPQQHQMQMPIDSQGNPNFADPSAGQSTYVPMSTQRQPQGGPGRQQKFNRQHVNPTNNINLVSNGRPRKRGRY